MTDADRRFRVHPLWREQWEQDERSPYQRLSEPDIGFGAGASRLEAMPLDTRSRVEQLDRRLAAQERDLGRNEVVTPIAPPESAPERMAVGSSLGPADFSLRERIGNVAGVCELRFLDRKTWDTHVRKKWRSYGQKLFVPTSRIPIT